MSEDEAAGLRKQIVRFHCISCDRPIDVQPHPFVLFCSYLLDLNFLFRQQPSLPANQGMRPIQSPRPYTTYELDQIRQFQKRLDHLNYQTKIKTFVFLVSSLVMSLVVVQQMFMQLFDNVVVHIQ